MLPSHQRYLFSLKYTFFSNYKLDAPTILIYDVNDGMWESKGNFQTAKEDNDDIIIKSTDDGKFNLDILCVSLPSIHMIL